MNKNQIEQVIRSTKSKNFAQTDFVQHSGPGTDMHSRNGRSTISFYKVFQQSLTEGNAAMNLFKESTAAKHKRLLEALAFVPEDVFNSEMLQNVQQNDIEELGRIAQEGKQQLIINKLETMIDSQIHKDILEAKPRSDSQMGRAAKDKKEDEKGGNKQNNNENAGQEGEDFLEQQIELYSNRIRAKAGQNASFNSIQRSNKQLQNKFYGVQISQGPIYRPDYKQIWKQSNSHVTMIDKVTEPRQADDANKPECLQQGKNFCSFEVRKYLRDSSQKQYNSTQPLNLTKTRQELTESKEALLTERKSKFDIYDPRDLPMKMIPEEKRYENQKIGQHNIKFELQKGREDNIMLTSPFPGDARFAKANANENRFDHLDVKYDKVSGKVRPLMMPLMKTQSKRRELFEKKDNNPDSNIYQTSSYGKSRNKGADQRLNLGSLQFDKRPLRYFHAPQKQFDVPDSYDHDKLEQAYNSTSQNKKIKGHVHFRSQIERDASMYNLDRKDFKSIEMELNRSPLNFNDYIPNSLKAINSQYIRPDSKQSYSTTNVTLSHSQVGPLGTAPRKSHFDSKSNFLRERFSSIVSKDGVFDYTHSRKDISASNQGSQILDRSKMIRQAGILQTSKSGAYRRYGNDGTPAKGSIAEFSQTPNYHRNENTLSLSNLHEDLDQKSQANLAYIEARLPRSLRSIQQESFDFSHLGSGGTQDKRAVREKQSPITTRMQHNTNNRAQSERALINASKAQKKNMIQQQKLINVQGSFLQFDEGSKKLLDVSRKIIKNPHTMITGEDRSQPTITANKSQMQV